MQPPGLINQSYLSNSNYFTSRVYSASSHAQRTKQGTRDQLCEHQPAPKVECLYPTFLWFSVLLRGGHQERKVTGHQRSVVPRSQACIRSLDTPNVLLHCSKTAVMLHLLEFGEQGNCRKLVADVELICLRLLARFTELRISKRVIWTPG